MQTGVAVGKKGELDRRTKGGVLGKRKAEVGLEGDEGGVGTGGAGMAAKVVLAGCEEDGGGGEGLAGG